MRKTKTLKKRNATPGTSFDGVFLLKLVFYGILGSLWLKPVGKGLALPLGLFVGLLFAAHEHFQIDRKIEYATLVIAALFGLLAPYGLYLGL